MGSKVLRAVVLDSAPNALINLEDTITSWVVSWGMMLSSVVDCDDNGEPVEPTQVKQAAAQAKLEIRREDSQLRRFWSTLTEEECVSKSRADTATLHALEPPVPLLFIYSTLDSIIRFGGVETYITECEERLSRAGLPPPQRLKYTDTQHCFHKTQKKDEYWRTVSSFLKEVGLRATS